MDNGLSPDHCGLDFEALERKLLEFPHHQKTACVNAIVEQLRKLDGIDRELIAVSLASLNKKGMTRKQIKKAVNMQLNVAQRKAFTKLLNELGPVPSVLAISDEVNKKFTELFDGVESRPLSKDDAHKLVLDYMSHWTEHLLKRKSVFGTVTFLKGGKALMTDTFYTNYAQKAANLVILRSNVQAIKPDAVVTVQAIWLGSKFSIGEKRPDDYMPSKDPKKREGLMVSVETHTDYWQAIQLFSKRNDGSILLEELIGPGLVETPEGCFIFMERRRPVQLH
jgi:copper chaperone CopZ